MSRPHSPLKGIALKVSAALTFTVMAAVIRAVGPDFPTGQVVFFRSFFALAPLLLFLALRGELHLATPANNIGAHLTRGLVGVASMLATFAGLALLPLAEATAIGYATPLATVVLAALFLGERVRLYRWSAVVVGFIGVLIMLSPALADLGNVAREDTHVRGALYALAGALFAASAMTMVRRMTATETTASIVFWFSVISSVVGLLTLPFGWRTPTVMEATLLGSIGLLGGVAQIFLTESYRHADASIVAPFDYTTMLFAVAIGYALFGEVPRPVVLVGAVIVIAAGLFVIFRERKLGLQRDAQKKAESGPA